jgi:hypothetical protein
MMIIMLAVVEFMGAVSPSLEQVLLSGAHPAPAFKASP